MHEESAEAKVEEGRSGTDESQSQRYLREALAAAEKFKYKFHLEQQVSLELARRYDECRQKHTDDRALINKMEKELEKLVKIGYHGRYPLSVTNIRTDASIELIEKISLVPYDYSTHRDSLPKSISGNDNVRVDESQPQRRLRKAVAVVDRFKFKYCQEKTISSELARECDNLKIKHNEDRVLIDSIERELKRLIRLGYKGVGPVTAHSSALSTPGQASSPQKRMMARSSDSSSATTDTDISADASVGDSGELLSLSSITTKRWNEIEDDSKISYECNKRIESEAKTGRFLDMEACIRNNEIEIHSEIQERIGKEKIEFLDLHEKIYETRDIGYEIESALLMKRREALTTNKGEGLESELFGVENIKKATEARNSKETERLKEIQHEIKIERETTMIAERLREIEMERLKEIQCEIERENLRETERLREIQHEIERENAINAVRLKEIESEIERGNVRVAKRLKEIHHEIERDNVKEMVESERLKEIEIEVERENAMKAEWLKEIEYKIEIENAIKFDRLKEIQYEIDRDNAMKAERLKEIERENVKETERLEEIENEKARERKRLEETEREAAREKERLREIEKETARETERLKVIERETARETERSKEIEGERERLKEIERETEKLKEIERENAKETEKLKEIERENARETEKLRKIHMINQTDIMRSEDVLKEVQHRLEQMTMPQLTPVITDGTINIPKDTVATSTLLSSSVPRPPFEVTVNHSEVEDRITGADEKGRRKVRNIEVLEEEEFEAPRLLSSSKCSQSQHTIRPTAIAAATATPSVDIINRDGVPSSISRPPAISVQKEPPPIKLFEHFLVVGASHQVRTYLFISWYENFQPFYSCNAHYKSPSFFRMAAIWQLICSEKTHTAIALMALRTLSRPPG